MKKTATGLTIFLLILTGCSKDLIYFPGTISEEVEKAVEGEYAGIIVGVNQAGETTLYSAGINNKEKQSPVDPNALFKIASLSKLYMAAAAVKLIANNDLSLDDPLSELIPEIKDRIEYSDEITLRMMIQHRSGIPEYVYHPDWPGRDPEESYLSTAELILDQPADFKPDKRHKYSNTNYLLLGEILDRTLGYSHHEYIRNEILQPLGLSHTYSLQSEVDTTQLMSGYYVDYEPDLKMLENHTRPGGSMIATAEDVGIFLRALIDGTLLSDQEQEIYSSVYVYEHTGWVSGYTSIVRYHEDIDAVIVQFINTSKNSMFWVGLERTYSRIVKAVTKDTHNSD